MRRARMLTATAIAASSLLLLGACGSDDTATPEPTPSATQTDCPIPSNMPKVSGAAGQAPTIAKPTGKPPTCLVVKDLVVGKGDEVANTTTKYNWNYTGASWSTGAVFDSSWSRGAPIAFSLNEVIPGWTEGLQGMKVGGRRELVIPPDMAYGAAGNPPAIAPNETLVFVVDLVGPA